MQVNQRIGAAQVEDLYAAAWPRLVGLLTVICGNRADAEEVAQEAFVRVVERWETVGTYADPEAWLRRVAIRLAISRHRRRQVADRFLQRHRHRLVEADQVGTVELSDLLSRLPIDHRTVLLLHHVEGLPIDEIATVLGVAPGTVKSRLSRARAALRPLLTTDESSTP